MRAVFLNKDGTLNENVPYHAYPKLIRLESEAVDGLRRLQSCGYNLIVVSNQSGVARGLFSEQDLHPVETHLRQLLTSHGIDLAGFYYCPHHPQGAVPRYSINCLCRKPGPGMLHQAANDYHLNLLDCWLIGDILNDIEAGNRVGCRTILLDKGYETEWNLTPIRRPDFVVRNLLEAAKLILMVEKIDNLQFEPFWQS